MSNDNNTLADVQPGGRVRLGNVRDRVMGECEQWFDTSDVDMEAATDSIIAAAQPSPGGQGDLKSRFTEWVKANSYNPATFASGRYMGDGVQVAWEAVQALAARQPVTMDDALAAGDGTLHGAIDHWQERALRAEAELAARQPVGEPVAWMHTHKTTGQVKFGLSPMYDCDFNAENWDSVALYAAPAQAVDLGQFRDLAQRWADKADLAPSPMTARSCSQQLLALIDSQGAR